MSCFWQAVASVRTDAGPSNLMGNFCQLFFGNCHARGKRNSARGGGSKRLQPKVNGEGLCIERYRHSKNDISPLIKPTHIVHATAARYR